MRSHKFLILRVIPFYRIDFLFLDRSATVTYDAARTAAGFIVTGKELRDHILGDKNIPYLYYSSEFAFHYKIMYSTFAPLHSALSIAFTFFSSTALIACL